MTAAIKVAGGTPTSAQPRDAKGRFIHVHEDSYWSIGHTQVFRQDNIVNALSGLGVPGQDRHEATAPGKGKRFTVQQMDQQYMHNRFARRIVDRPAKDASRAGWKLTVNTAELVDPMGPELERLKSRFFMREAHRMSRLTGGGAVIIILDDGRALEEPVDREHIRKVQTLQYVDRWELIPIEHYADITHPMYGKPRLYRLHPKGFTGLPVSTKPGSQGTIGSLVEIHADRVIRFEGLPIRRERKDFYDGWGQPVLEAAWEAIADINVTIQSMATTMHEFQFQVLKLKDLKTLLIGPNGSSDRFTQRLAAIQLSKSMLKAVAIDADREELEVRSIDFTGAIGVYSVMQQNLSAVTEMPLSLLFGQMPQGFASADETGQQNYREHIQGMQDEFYEPGLQKLGSYIVLSDEGPFKKLEMAKRVELTKGIKVEFNSLEKPNQVEMAQVREGLARADAAWIGAGVLQPSDARRRFQEQEFQLDIFIDPKREVKLQGFEEMERMAQQVGQPGSAPSQVPMKPPAPPQPPNPAVLQEERANARFDSLVEMFEIDLTEQKRQQLYAAAESREEEPAMTLLNYLAWETQQERADAVASEEAEALRTGRKDVFTGANDPKLPDHVKKLAQAKKTQWVAAFNATFEETDGDEGKAFAAANAVVK